MTDTEPMPLTEPAQMRPFEPGGIPHPLTIIQAAIVQKMPAAELRELFELQKTFERDRAAEAFSEALAEFQSRMPPVKKCRKATGGNIQFDYASFDDVWKQASPHLQHCRLAITFDTEPTEKGMRIICRVRKGIHQEESGVTIRTPAGKVTETQLDIQTTTYGKRIAMCLGLGIVCTDEDVDGNREVQLLTGDEVDQLEELLDECKKAAPVTHDDYLVKFFKWLKVGKLSEIPRSMFVAAVDNVNGRIAKAKGAHK